MTTPEMSEREIIKSKLIGLEATWTYDKLADFILADRARIVEEAANIADCHYGIGVGKLIRERLSLRRAGKINP